MRQQDRAGAALAAATGLGVTLIGLAAGLLGLRIGGLTPAGALAVSALEAWLASALLAALLLWPLFLWLRRDVRARPGSKGALEASAPGGRGAG